MNNYSRHAQWADETAASLRRERTNKHGGDIGKACEVMIAGGLLLELSKGKTTDEALAYIEKQWLEDISSRNVEGQL